MISRVPDPFSRISSGSVQNSRRLTRRADANRCPTGTMGTSSSTRNTRASSSGQ